MPEPRLDTRRRSNRAKSAPNPLDPGLLTAEEMLAARHTSGRLTGACHACGDTPHDRCCPNSSR
jgi:hypothetical protein